MTAARPCDVIVVGGGFAGVTAARELAQRGASVLLLEASDRLGGRTWATERLGHLLELGGGWIHWLQPHVWAEAKRYDLELVASPEPERAAWFVGEERHEGGGFELFDNLSKDNELLLARSREYFPEPYDPLANPAAAEIDDISLTEAIERLELPREREELLIDAWTLACNAPIDTVAFSQALRWTALCGGSWPLFVESAATWKFKRGTRSLYEAIAASAASAGAEVRLGAAVTSVRQDDQSAVVTLASGEQLTTKAVVLTMSLHSLRELDIPFSAERRAAVNLGQASSGFKCWIRVRGKHAPIMVFGRAHFPLALVFTEIVEDDTSILVGMGPRADAIDLTNVAEIQEQVGRLIPGAEVIDVTAHDWVRDPLARETWPVQTVGSLAAYAQLKEPEGRIVLAGSDYAGGWAGYVDGAIESAFAGATKVADLIGLGTTRDDGGRAHRAR